MSARSLASTSSILNGFDDVVVRTFVDSLDRLVPAAARRQHKDGDGKAGAAPAAQHRQAIDARESEIEQHRVVAFRSGKEIGTFAVGRAVDGIPGAGQRRRQLLRQRRFVFDDQNSHGLLRVLG